MTLLVISASCQCCCCQENPSSLFCAVFLSRTLKPAEGSLAVFTLAEPCSFLPLPHLCCQGNKSKLHWKGKVTGVILDRKFHEACQITQAKFHYLISKTLGQWLLFFLSVLKMCTACYLAVAFSLSVCDTHFHAQVSCSTCEYHVEYLCFLWSLMLVLFDYCFHLSFIWLLCQEFKVFFFSFYSSWPLRRHFKKKTI